MLRLRQITLVAADLDAVVGSWRSTFGLDVAYRDPAVAAFGLHNAVMPVGNQFVEVVSPIRSGTAAGRYLDRRGGDGGYMVILQTDHHHERAARVAALGIRIAFERADEHHRIMQLHPADTGGSFLEIDEQAGGDAIDGPWGPAGPDWQRARRTDVVDGISVAEIQSPAPGHLAARWGDILDRPVGERHGLHVIELDNAELRFLEAVDGRGEGLGGVELHGAGSPDAAPRHPTTPAGGLRVAVV